MELWTVWTHLLEATLGYLAVHFGLSEAIAIIALTLIARTILMPLSLTAAYRMQRNKEAMERMRPALEALRKTLKDDPAELAQKTMALYRKNGIALIDKVSLLNIGAQGVFGLGLFQCLRRMTFSSKFLWIASLAKPDYWLTALVAALMLLGMILMPGANANSSMLLMFAVSIAISVVAIAALPSALGVYWATSNVMTVVQSLVLRGLATKRAHLAA
jgi:YidC/Oxa1 family membrane protein insertase